MTFHYDISDSFYRSGHGKSIGGKYHIIINPSYNVSIIRGTDCGYYSYQFKCKKKRPQNLRLNILKAKNILLVKLQFDIYIVSCCDDFFIDEKTNFRDKFLDRGRSSKFRFFLKRIKKRISGK